MKQVDYNKPNTRARVEARRQMRKSQRKARGDRQRPASSQAALFSFRVNRPIPNPALKTRTQELPRLALKSRNRGVLQGGDHQARGAQVKPGLRRILLSWLHTGRMVSLLLFLIATGGLAYMMISSQFTVQHVRVEGNTLLDSETIIALAGVHTTPIWFVNSQHVMQRIRQNPYIEHVQVTMTLPDRVALQVTERRPEVYWKIGPISYLVDDTGKVLEITREPPGPEVLVIEDTTPHVLQPHDQVDPDALTLAHILSVRLPEELGLAPSTLGWNYGLGVYIETDEGRTVVFGQNDHLDRKLSILRELLETNTPFTYLDLRPSNPFYQHDPPTGDPGREPAGNNQPVSHAQQPPPRTGGWSERGRNARAPVLCLPVLPWEGSRRDTCAALFNVKMMGRICNPLSLA